MTLEIFTILTAVFAAIDVIAAVASYLHHNKVGTWLGHTALFAAMTTIMYALSVNAQSYFWVSFFSSLYFISVDLLVVGLVILCIYFVDGRNKITQKQIFPYKLYLIFDIVVLLINPFKEIAVSYVRTDTVLMLYEYKKYALYYGHLAFSYILVIIALSFLIKKMITVAAIYRKYFSNILVTIIFIVAANAIFLYAPLQNIFGSLDFSILAYSFAILFFYYDSFEYVAGALANQYSSWIIANVEQGIVLFDYDNKPLVHNKCLEEMLPDYHNGDLKELLDTYQSEEKFEKESKSFQFYVVNNTYVKPLRCDYRPLIEKNQIIGRLFVFSEVYPKKDVLTGFNSYSSFVTSVNELKNEFNYPICITAFDINRLAYINQHYGNTSGDRIVLLLANLLKKYYPENSYFVRGNDATLIVIANINNEEKEKLNKKIAADFVSPVKDANYKLTFQAGTSIIANEDEDLIKGVEKAIETVEVKKLLDSHSTHATYLSSLIRALKESDVDTEEHVKRTRDLGERLGKRIGLSDLQQSKLALLCLLHDIGKIGIPLEILNKPGKLTKEEWESMKAHTSKGYQIALSTSALNGIANEILHHHERWDGKGYPEGLAKEAIPLLSRIISVVDSYDAMTSDRIYRKALSKGEALAEIRACAGSQFDPSLALEFCQMIEESEGVKPVNAPAKKQASTKAKVTESKRENQAITMIPFCRYIIDDDMRILETDNNFEMMTGFNKDDIDNGLKHTDLIPGQDLDEYLDKLAINISSSDMGYFGHRVQKKNGEVKYFFCLGRKFFDAANKTARHEIILSDISNTNGIHLMDNTHLMADNSFGDTIYRYDSLTGLLNQEAFKNEVDGSIIKGGSKAVMVLFDMDEFHFVNQNYGRKAGDELLINFANCLKDALRKDDLASRINGDEFGAVILFEEAISDEAIRYRVEQLYQQLDSLFTQFSNHTGFSMGVCIQSKQSNSFTKLFQSADNALNTAKNSNDVRYRIVR